MDMALPINKHEGNTVTQVNTIAKAIHISHEIRTTTAATATKATTTNTSVDRASQRSTAIGDVMSDLISQYVSSRFAYDCFLGEHITVGLG